VEDIAGARGDWPDIWRLAALLHDAPEFVIGDLISPFKAAIGLNYKAFEARLLGAIHRRFGLPDALPAGIAAIIKDADRIAAYYEATRLAGFTEAEAAQYFGGPPPGLPPELTARLERLAPVATGAAQQAFLIRYETLSARGAPA